MEKNIEGKRQRKMRRLSGLFLFIWISVASVVAQINTDRVMSVGRNALYFEDYVLSIQYFNQVTRSKPWLAEPYFYRAVAKINLEDFKGAEEDCSACIERNPFFAQAYYARGIARQSQEQYDEAIADYEMGLKYRPADQSMLSNKAVAYIQSKQYEKAEGAFEDLLNEYPRNSMNYMMRGAMYIEKGDTLKALNDYDRSIEMDSYYAPAYGNRALLHYQMNETEKALEDLNEAIRLDNKSVGYFINRGLVRYQMNDLRGAMADYDQVIVMETNNLIARFNRGLLRFQVGDNNRAIEDFNVVLSIEPDNYMAYYNRALLHNETGDWQGAIDDFSTVLATYPQFVPAYYSRAEAKRQSGDTAGADRDMWTAYEIEQAEREKRQTQGQSQTASNDKKADGKADSNNEDKTSEKASEKDTREESDKTISKFNRLVVYDKEEERKSKYSSEIRGRVQDKNVQVDIEPMFVLTYYQKPDAVKTNSYYDRALEEYNAKMILPMQLLLTNREAALNESQVERHFASIDHYSSRIASTSVIANLFFARGMDYLLVQDFAHSIADFDQVVELDPTFTMAYFNRAVVRYKVMAYEDSQETENSSATPEYDLSTMSFQVGGRAKSTTAPSANKTLVAQNELKKKKRSYDYELISRDYDRVIQLNPDFVYAYFNRANLRCLQRDFRAAIVDYDEAIRRDPSFAEAYFNRGLAKLSLGESHDGIADLSKAGELGIINAYNIIKRMSK